MPELGSIVAGKYRVVRQIGAGGMGTVVAAEHVHLGTPLALKFLSEKIKDSTSSVERFTREARACAQLKSEHVCRVTDFGVDGGVPYLAMELLEGVDLSRLLDGGPLDIATATDYVLQACVGLAEAHALGIVHRDLKPHNLFLTRRPDGSALVKVLDFGIAKFPVGSDHNHALTRTATVVGSPGYMAPEQLRSSKTVDIRADVWALGVILYELVSNRHPFRAEAVTEIALKIAMDEAPPLTEAPALEAVVMKCLAKEPDARFQDVGALAEALAPFAATGAASATAVGRILGDSTELRRTTPHLASLPPLAAPELAAREAETVREAPRPKLADTTQQYGSGMVAPKPAPKRRTGLYVGIGVVAAGGIAAAVIATSTRGEDPPVVATTPTPLDAAIAKLEVPVDAAVIAPPADAAIAAADAAAPVDAGGYRTRTPQPGSASIRRDATKPVPASEDVETLQTAVKSLRDTMVQRGLLASDLGSAESDQLTVATALARGDTEGARVALDHWRVALKNAQIDRFFIQGKISRTQAAVRAAKLPADRVKPIDDQLTNAMTAYGDGNFVLANKRLNEIVAALKGGRRTAPSESPRDKLARDKAEQAKIDLARNVDLLLDRINNGFSSPIDLSSACFAVINLDRSRVPWDRCVAAQCKVNPATARTMAGFAPVTMQDGLRQLCPLK